MDYSRSYFTLYLEKPNQGLIFHAFSDMVSSYVSGYNIITFYISIIIVIGRLIRGFISGEAERIVFTEMPEPNKIITLCESIKISRYISDFER